MVFIVIINLCHLYDKHINMKLKEFTTKVSNDQQK